MDNSAYPQIAVNIRANFTVPANAKKPVPIMIEFGFGFGRPGFVPAWKPLAISKGWGYGEIIPASIQPDNNQLRTGIIGLTNKGQPRKPDDWGALRAWQWGVSRLIDYFEANRDAMVDAKKVGIEGLSRYGKAAIVTQAFDTRVAVGLIGSSGEGGVKLHRHLFGEAVENLAGGEYYWMAGNFIKYGASDPPMTAADLPVDSHELIALCAPRPCFISYGTVERGDAKWVDAHGSFMAAVLAGPVYRLLGKKDLGTPGEYLTDPMPPVQTLIGGELAWRQHEGGHDVTPNWPAFFGWVQQYIKAPPLPDRTSPQEKAMLLPSSDAPQKNAPGNALPLKNAYKDKILVGTALNYPALQGRSPMDVDIATTHFNALTPANSMKPDALQRVEGRFTFADGDRLVEIAEKCGAAPIGHVLVWHEQTPAWFFQGPDGQPVSRELALARLRKHISAVVGHYKGRVKQWDVVNEAISDTPGEALRPTPWLKAIGPDYIAEAFRAAHEADPDAILIYNDYNIELAYKRPKALQLLKSLLDQKIPVHAVGIQSHWRLNTPDFAEVEAAIKQFSDLGLKVMITELDVGVLPTQYQGANIAVHETMTPEQQAVMNPYTGGLPEPVAQQLAERYRQAFAMFLRHKDVIGRVTLWGTQDGDSWLNNFPVRGRADYPLLFDREGKPKPAFFAVERAATP